MAKTSQNSIFKIRYSLIFDLVHHCMSMPNVSKVVLDLDMIQKHIFLDPDPVSKLHRCHKIFQSFFRNSRNKSQNHSFPNPNTVSKIHFNMSIFFYLIGGSDGLEDVNTTDIIDLDDENSICHKTYYPIRAQKIEAGLLNISGVMTSLFCGGDPSYINCFTYFNGFHQFTSLTHEANFAASVVMNNAEFLWITGGYNSSVTFQSKTQLVFSNGSILAGPEMPKKLANHCIVALSGTTALIIGGRDEEHNYSNKTFLYDFESKEWSNGSELAIERYRHACAVCKNDVNNELMIFVIGGYNKRDGDLDSVEMALIKQEDILTLNWEWVSGNFNFLSKNSQFRLFARKLIILQATNFHKK